MDILLHRIGRRRRVGLGLTAVVALAAAGCQPVGPPAVPPTDLMAIDTPPPAYPPELACNDIGGQVTLLLTVGTDGRVSAVQTLEGSQVPALDAAAAEAVQNWRFEPATAAGQPVAKQLNVPVTFTPPEPKPDSCLKFQE